MMQALGSRLSTTGFFISSSIFPQVNRRRADAHDEGDQLAEPPGSNGGGVGGHDAFDDHVHEEWGDPAAIATLRSSGLGNYEPDPDKVSFWI